MTETDYLPKRRAMVASQLRPNAVNDPRVVVAMGNVARELYVPAEWQGFAYADRAIPLGGGRTLPPAMALGRLLTESRVRPSDRVLVVGAATGYAAAVLAELAVQVIALDDGAYDAPLPGHVERVAGPLAEGWAAGAPYDLILIDGAVEEVPPALVEQLADGGRLAAPVIRDGIVRLSIGVRGGAGFGMVDFADADVPALPGFEKPRAFTF